VCLRGALMSIPGMENPKEKLNKGGFYSFIILD